MRLTLLALLLLVTSCAPSIAESPSRAATSAASALVSPTASPRATDTELATSSPPARSTARSAQPPPAPDVKVAGGSFGILTDLTLRPAAVDDQLVLTASSGVSLYLQSIDAYRDGSSPALPITGAFLAAVSAALKDSATPG